MRIHRIHAVALAAASMAGATLVAPAARAQSSSLGSPVPLTWSAVATMADVMPGDSRVFNSFNQPSVDTTGLVTLRGRSKGPEEPQRGIYSRRMGASPGPLTKVFDRSTTVPQPNNVDDGGALRTFTEFPAFPRIDATGGVIVTRGQSQPVWKYLLPDGTETRAGTSGVFVQRLGQGESGMTQLGNVPGFEYFAVPGAAPGTKFDQFPGAPTVAAGNKVVFKGNYTEGVSKTGIFFRGLGGDSPVQRIASSDTLIPGEPAGGTKFGSTAPPSVADKSVVFLGLDVEEAPTKGAIYKAALASGPKLKPLVKIGDPVPGEAAGAGFTRLGEALSYDGRFVGFWGAWGAETRTITLICPTDGQKDVIAYCLEQYPNGHEVQVPVNQGFFVHDTLTHVTSAVAKTGIDFLDMEYWTFSGRPPGSSESDGDDFEPPRWRAAAFVANWGVDRQAQVVFKARRQTGVDGLYFTTVAGNANTLHPVVETGWDGATLDPAAAGMPITTLGLERDGLRKRWLAISASMANATASWAGVYVARTAK